VQPKFAFVRLTEAVTRNTEMFVSTRRLFVFSLLGPALGIVSAWMI
jgi:hypothetical protein